MIMSRKNTEEPKANSIKAYITVLETLETFFNFA